MESDGDDDQVMMNTALDYTKVNDRRSVHESLQLIFDLVGCD